jgi:hypothetical protein
VTAVKLPYGLEIPTSDAEVREIERAARKYELALARKERAKKKRTEKPRDAG